MTRRALLALIPFASRLPVPIGTKPINLKATTAVFNGGVVYSVRFKDGALTWLTTTRAVSGGPVKVSIGRAAAEASPASAAQRL
jgi:hypothetical protein